MEKYVKIEQHPDGRITIILNDFFDNQTGGGVGRGGRGGGRPPTSESTGGFMSFGDYYSNLKRIYREDLSDRYVDFARCRFVSLTPQRDMEWSEFTDNVDRFLAAVNRAHPNTEYLRAIEMQNNKERRLHAHLLLLFSGEVPHSFTLGWIEQTWKCGKCHLREQAVDHGAFQYLTTCKNKFENKTNLTRFPRGAKVLSKSRNFGVIVKPTEMTITQEESMKMIAKFKELYRTGWGNYVREDQHRYIDYATGEVCVCTDRIYLRPPKNLNIMEVVKNYDNDEIS